MSEIPPPPTDTVLLVFEVNTEDVHFVDNIVKSYDHIAQVRRDYRIYRGRPFYEMLVPPQLLEEAKEILDRLRNFIWVGQVVVLPKEQGDSDS